MRRYLKTSKGGFLKRAGNPFRLFKDYLITHSRLIIRNVVIVIAVSLVVFIAVGLLVFRLMWQGPPEVAVPNITGKDLIGGLIALQNSNLHAVVDPRFFSDSEKNTIVEQNPKPGSIVREGKDVRIIVSKGPIISVIEDYTGMTVVFVRNRLQEIFSFQGKTIQIGKISTLASDSPRGTIVSQYPPPNTPIAEVDAIDLVVSKGREVSIVQLADYTYENIKEVMETLALKGILVHVVPEEVDDPEQDGIILAQEPPEGTLVSRNETVTFYVGYLPTERQKDTLSERVIEFEVPVDVEDEAVVRIVVQDRIGEREIYHEENMAGDLLTIPFKSYSNTTAFIYVDGGLQEVLKYE